MTTPQTPDPSRRVVQKGTAFPFTAQTAGSRYDLMVGRDDTGSWLIAVTNMSVSARVGHLDDPNYLAERLKISRVDAAQIIECIDRHLRSSGPSHKTSDP